MKNMFKHKLKSVFALVLAFALVLGVIPFGAIAATDSESDKLVDMFYKDIIGEYGDDVYEVIYEQMVKYGLLQDAAAKIDDLIAQVKEAEAQIPADVPEEIPEELPEDWPEEIPENWLEQIPQDVLDKIPEDLLQQLVDKYGNGKAESEPVVFTARASSSNEYTEFVAYVIQLREEVALTLDTLNELKAILEGDELSTYAGLVENYNYLKAVLPERIERIELLWLLLAENEDINLDPAQILKAIEIMEKVEYELENTVFNAVDSAVRAIAATVYEPACQVMEIFLDKKIESAEEVVEALKEIYNMPEDERNARIQEIIYDATHDEYVIDNDSYYVAFGNINTRDSYVALLAEKLGVDVADYSQNDMTVEQLAEQLNQFEGEIKKADLITLNFAEVENVVKVVNNMASLKADCEAAWEKYAGEGYEGLQEKVAAVLAGLYLQLTENGIDKEYAKSFVDAAEAYICQYAGYLINIDKVATQIQKMNPEAVVVVVGAYNPLNGTTVTYKGVTIEVGEYLSYLFDAFGVIDLVYAIFDGNITYVNAPDVDVLLSEKELDETVAAKLNAISLMPSEAGHAYIADQIWNALIITNNKDTECDHTFGEWIETVAPGCTTEGEETRTCSACGETETRTVAALDHAWQTVSETQATCSDDGVKLEKCSRCGEERETITDKAHGNHNWDVLSETKATCAEDGLKVEKCLTCGLEKTTVDPAHGNHDWHWVIDKEATEETTGLKHEECKVCGKTRNEGTVIPAQGTTPDTGSQEQLGLLCAVLLISACGVMASVYVLPRKKGKYER